MYKVVLLIAYASVATSAPADWGFSSVNEFSLNLLQNVFAFEDNFGPKNIALSPVSVWNVFSLLAEGASGATFDELSQLLRLPKEMTATQKLHEATEQVLSRTNKNVKLKKQPTIFNDRKLKVHEEFCQSATRYNTDIYTVDTRNTTKLANDINYYICLATEGRIKNAVKPTILENLSVLLIDAIYFKANWTNPFHLSETTVEPFYDQQGRNIGTVNMMHQKAKNTLEVSEELEADILEMTYGTGKELSMVFFLPLNGVPLKRLLNNLSTHPAEKWLSKLKTLQDEPDVDCYVPRFKVKCEVDLVPALKYMGLYNIFDEAKSELPGISDSPLFVSKAMQNVDLEVNEEGTVAAAVTSVGLENRLGGLTIELNRPFAYAILEKKSNVVLFAGVYHVPSME